MVWRSSLTLSILLCLILASPVHPLSFSLKTSPVIEGRFCSAQHQDVICLVGDASYGNQTIQLTSFDFSAGRAFYSDPLHLWDSKTRKLTSFTSNFDIAITRMAESPDLMADGVAFFLAGSSELPPGSKGGFLGLQSKFDNKSAPFVAVEVDSFPNTDGTADWDPSFRHIGIDINSVKSVKTAELVNSSQTSDIRGRGTVRYDASSRTLSFRFSYQKRSVSLSYAVDLRDVLPELVVVGLSGGTGSAFERNTVISWDFQSL